MSRVSPEGFPHYHGASPESGRCPYFSYFSNCAFGPGRYLYVTNDHQVVRGRIRADFPGGSPIVY